MNGGGSSIFNLYKPVKGGAPAPRTGGVKPGLSPGARALILHAAVVAAVIAGGYLIYRSGFMPGECVFYCVTGSPCIACGGTRAAYSLLRFQIARSFMYNPIPALFAAASAGLLITESVRLAAGRKDRLPRRTVPAIVLAILAAALIFSVLRWCGVLPRPEEVPAFFQ